MRSEINCYFVSVQSSCGRGVGVCEKVAKPLSHIPQIPLPDEQTRDFLRKTTWNTKEVSLYGVQTGKK